MELVRLNYDHYQKILAHDKENFPNDYWKEGDWKNLLNDIDCHYYAYILDRQIAANVFVDKNPDGYIKIMHLAVSQELRGKGLAAKLLSFVTEKFTQDGYFRFYAETRESNLAMQKSFEKSGYQFRCLVENMFENPPENGFKYQLILEKRK